MLPTYACCLLIEDELLVQGNVNKVCRAAFDSSQHVKNLLNIHTPKLFDRRGVVSDAYFRIEEEDFLESVRPTYERIVNEYVWGRNYKHVRKLVEELTESTQVQLLRHVQ